jgi:protease-4
MIRRFFRGLWGAITVVRGALANIIFLVVLLVLFFALTERPEPLPERAALRLDLDGRVVDERTQVDTSSLLLGAADAGGEILLTDLIDSVDLARRDERIVALVLELDGLLSIGQSKTTELAAAIERFRAAGKPVVAVGDYFSQDQYRLAVEADTLLMHPFGAVAVEGYGYYVNYFAEALDKLSVTMNVFRAGDFKSIAEPFLRSDMSPGEREISRRWLEDLWSAYREAVENRRGLEAGQLDALLAAYPERLRAAGGDAARLALREGLVDDLLDRSQRDAFLTALVGADDGDGHYLGVDFDDYLARQRPGRLAADASAIAVVTAQGNIVPGDPGLGAVGSQSLREMLRRSGDFDNVKAIVLRVNSGGGSVFASELIREELVRLRREEGLPVVVSMGSVAASGGYYIATAADRILATPTTLTGSIGVFAAFPTFEKLLARGGVYTDGVGSTPVAGGLRPDRPVDPAIANALQQGVDSIYRRFLDLVAQSRDLDPAALDAVAEGRVLSARQARDAGLIDGIGSLDDAAKLAAELAGLAEDDYEVITMRPAITPREILLQRVRDMLGAPSILAAVPMLKTLPGADGPVAGLAPVLAGADALRDLADPRHLYMRCLACGAVY